MNKEQIKTMLKSVRTDLELFKCTRQGHYLDRAKNGLKRLRRANIKRLLDNHEFKILREHELWTHF